MKRLHGWETKTLSDVAEIGGGNGFPDSYQGKASGDHPFIKVSDLNLPGNERLVLHANNWISDDVRKKLKAKVFPKGAVVFAKVGGALLTNKRRILTRDTVIDNNMMALTPKCIHSGYLYQVLLSIDMGRYRQEGAVPSINGSRVGEISIDVPPDIEQRKVADILGKWDAAQEKLDAIIAVKDRRKQALMQQLLSGGLRLRGFKTCAWKSLRMADALERIFRPAAVDQKASLPLVSVRRRLGGLFRRPDVLASEYKTQDLHILKAGDFLISKRQVVHGAWAIVEPEFEGTFVSKEYAILVNRAPAKLDMRFFAWLAQTPWMVRLARVASTGVHIEKLIFDPIVFLREKIRIPVDVKEQVAIATVVDTADAELRLLRQQRAALDQQKRGLMQRLLTGKVRVRL